LQELIYNFFANFDSMSSLLPYKTKNAIEAGCDEAGRGCLAGPVVAAAVILPADFKNELLDDSKKLTEAKRKKLRPIIEKEALAWGVSFVDEKEIDEINILNASFTAMHRAVDQLEVNEKMMDPTDFTFEGEIVEVCSKAGCWVNVDAGNGETFMVRFKDHFTIPPGTEPGTKAYFHGTAFNDTVSVELLQHFAEDAGKSQEEIDKITEPKFELGFTADGIVLQKEEDEEEKEEEN
jgi:hypothetical protein